MKIPNPPIEEKVARAMGVAPGIVTVALNATMYDRSLDEPVETVHAVEMAAAVDCTKDAVISAVFCWPALVEVACLLIVNPFVIALKVWNPEPSDANATTKSPFVVGVVVAVLQLVQNAFCKAMGVVSVPLMPENSVSEKMRVLLFALGVAVALHVPPGAGASHI